MLKNNSNDTIAAIATPVGVAGIGIVRLSGKDALKIADKIFLSKDKKKPSTFKTYTVHYGWIIDRLKTIDHRPKEKNNTLSAGIIDEVLLTVMRAPRSYTREDVVEINCHGGIVAQRAVLDLVLKNGCRVADPGEFTKRAFLNGRIDLAQAEAVLDIIKAKTDTALRISNQQLKGVLSREINTLRKKLLDILMFLEANIDFPEEEIGTLNLKKLTKDLKSVNSALKDILASSGCARVLREGVHVVICGKPNVGKSSLLNTLLKQERSIVTSIAGTTRDTIEEIIDIKGIPVRIVDTAGIIEPRDLVEKKAVKRSREHIDLADIVILVFDGSKKINKDDRALMKKIGNKPTIAVINKIDLKQKIEKEKVQQQFKQVVGISAKKIKNISLLEEAIVNLVYSGKAINRESVLVSNQRHIAALKKAEKLIEETAISLDNKLPLEFIAQNIKDALVFFDDILGKRFCEDLLDKIFSEFCIGK